jgi:hypothetical protein
MRSFLFSSCSRLWVWVPWIQEIRSCSLPVSRPKTRSQTQAHNNLVSEPGFDMVDQRLECLQKEMIELSQYQPTLIYGGKNCQKSGGDGGYSSQPISEFSFGCREL